MKKYWLIIVLLLLVQPIAQADEFDFDIYGGAFTIADKNGSDIYGSVPNIGIRGIYWWSNMGLGVAMEGRSGEGKPKTIGIPSANITSSKAEFTQSELDIGVFFRPTTPTNFYVYGGLGLAIINMEEKLNANYYYYRITRYRYYNRIRYISQRVNTSLSASATAQGVGGFALIGISGEVTKDLSLFGEVKVTGAKTSEKNCFGKDVQIGGVTIQGGLRF